MRYAEIEDGAIRKIHGNPQWFKDDGEALTETEYIDLNLLPLIDVSPTVDYTYQTIQVKDQSEWTIQADKVLVTYTIIDRSFDDCRNSVLGDLAMARYENEIAGITVNDISINSDRQTQVNFIASKNKAEEDSQMTMNWKFVDGWVVLNAAEIINCANGLFAYVQLCFGVELNYCNQIVATTTIQELQAINIGAISWPSRAITV